MSSRFVLWLAYRPYTRNRLAEALYRLVARRLGR